MSYCLALFALLPTIAQGQDSVRLRFEPWDGLQLQRVFDRYQRVVTWDAAQDAQTRELEQTGGVTQVAWRTGASGAAVHLSFDSLRLRHRTGGSDWADQVIDGADTTWLQVSAGELLQVGPRGGRLQPGTGPLLLQLLTGLSGFTLPESWIREGMQWQREIFASPSDPLIPGSMDDVALRMRATFLADSIVRRAQDTLVYMTVRAGAIPYRRLLDDGVTLAYDGSFSGTLVWSTGWRALVSVATRLFVQADVRQPGTAAPVGHMTIETVLRQTVAP